MLSIAYLVNLVFEVLLLAIFASIVISWLRVFGVRVPHDQPIVRIIEDTADLILKPIRRTVRATGGGFDFSPIIAVVLLEIVRRLVIQVL